MLDAMRRTAGTWVVRIFLVILIGSFAVWGIGDFIRGSTDISVAKVGGTEISPTEYSEQLRRELQRLQSQLGGPVDAAQARALGLNEQVLRTMIGRRLLDLEAEKLRVVVPDDVVAAEIRNNAAFQGPTNQFDRPTYERAVMAQGWSPTRFEYLLRQDMTRDALAGSVVAGLRGGAPKVLVDRIQAYRGERREAEIAVLDPKGEVAAPDEATLRKFHQENAARFTAPELRSFAYLTVEAKDVADTIQLTDKELQDEYESRLSTYREPERRRVEQMLFPDQAAADAAFAKLKDGGNFAAVAKETLGQEAADLSLGLVTQSELPEEIGAPVFALAQGEISKPVQSPFGWHILRVSEIQPAREKKFEEAKDELARELKLQRASDELYRIGAQVQDEIAGGASIDQLAAKLNVPVKRVAAMDARGRDVEGRPVPGLPQFREFLPLVNEVVPGGEPEVREMSEGAYVVVRVDGVTPSALRPFEAVQAAVLEAWRSVAHREQAEAAAKALIEKAKTGGDFAELAREAGAEIRSSGAFTRDGTGADRVVSGQLAAQLFAAKVGDLAEGPAGDGRGYVVARLASISPADPGDAAARERLAKNLGAGYADDIATLYRSALEGEYGVSINRQNLDRTN
ncbi:peptidylprolyl isomerase [Desertibaculum subflavum]|uniref:peptidylprolyl isomerase n=1 Tax=Desertibaculum subflavum TaxID=2268458 RepID=UPI000E66AA00